MRLPAVVTGALSVCGLVSTGCAGDRFVKPPPVVRFTKPAAAILYLEGGGAVVRIHFDGKRRLAPVFCRDQGHMYPTRKMNPSVRFTLKRLSAGPGHRPFRLFDAKGRLLAHGKLCIFPTWKTRNRKIKRVYTIRIPEAVLERSRAGKLAVAFQDYKPAIKSPQGWRYVAWVVSLTPP